MSLQAFFFHKTFFSNMVSDKELVSRPTVILSILSVISCLYVCISAYNAGAFSLNWCRQNCCKSCRKKKKRGVLHHSRTASILRAQNSVMMTDIVFYMCLTDGLHATEMALNWFPIALNSSSWVFWNKLQCKILGIIGQFVCIQSPVWHLILAYHLGYLLCGGTLDKLNKQKKYYFILVILIPLIATIIPAIYYQYGKYIDTSYDFECWLKSENWQFIWVGAVMFSLFVHYVVLIIAFCKWRQNMLAALLGYYKLIVIKLSRFVVVFTIVRLFPSIERIYVLWCGQDCAVPVWLICAHHWSVASLGLSNGIVWIINQRTGRDMAILMGDDKRGKLVQGDGGDEQGGSGFEYEESTTTVQSTDTAISVK